MHIEEKELMEMALIGYGMELARIDQQISEVRAMLALGDRTADIAEAVHDHFAEMDRPTRHISPEGRARIIAATKKRWAAWRREKKAGRA